MAVATDPDLCVKCGNQFPADQACYLCATDRATILCAVEVLKRRSGKRGFWGDVIIRVLERYASRLGDA